jgi:peptidyl-prolyl cis-trans isomerase A (cyclophilin A)
VMVIPTVLPPSSGTNFLPIQPGQQPMSGAAPNYTSTYNSPSATPAQANVPLRSEIITFDEKPEDRPVLVVKTSEGEFKVKMAPDVNRQTVQHFMGLAQGSKEFIDIRTGKKVRRPFYTGLNCHRVVKGVLIQCGCPFGNGRGNPGVFAKDERNPGLRFDRPGIVAMALQLRPQPSGLEDAPDTAGSQFFISLAKLPEFDGKYAILGEITSGMDTIRKIASSPTGPTDRPIKRVVIFSIDPDITALPVAPTAPTATVPDPMLSPMDNLAPGGLGIDPFALPPSNP